VDLVSTTTEARAARAPDDAREKAAARTRTQLERYETWVRELEARRAELLRNKPLYTKIFWALPPASLLGLLHSVGMGAATLFTAVLMTVFGFYTVAVRESDYRVGLKEARKRIAELKKELPPEG
jgi:hypothetical protein